MSRGKRVTPPLGRLRVRVLRALVRALLALPPGVQVRLSGRPPVQLDGDTLAPSIQLMLRLLELTERGGEALETLTPTQAREDRRRTADTFGAREPRVTEVRDLDIGEPGQPLPARHYAPPGGARPLILFFHGGGFVFGDLDTHDGVCRTLALHAGAHVLAVDYRLAPEDPFPAAVQDAHRALRWARAHAGELGADPASVAVAGDSAGGNIAAVTCQVAAAAGEPQPVLQLLIYPVTEFGSTRRSRELFGDGFFLTNASMDWFDSQYLGDEAARARDPYASPLLAESLAGLAPAIVATAAFDPLRDEGEAYAAALRDAGVPVVARRFSGLVHGFASQAGIDRCCREALLELAGAARAMLAVADARA
ncbi:MAG TPA: alpha/beta hydrolase [Solirubrobacteraceae bacterium]|jgi:acetyl esterase|nr:alpha/beta hydrolase [Solirubrobacteraceae bacterium]